MEPMVLTVGNENKQLFIEIDDTNGLWETINFFIATGKDAKNFRVELWNGSRDGETTTTGTVFFDDIAISTSASNFESARYEDLFYTGTLGNLKDEKFDEINKVLYTRELTETEIKFNKEYPDKKVSYRQNYIWAKSEYTVYAVYNTINPVETNPYDSITDEENTTSGCGEVNSSTFWFSFSSIVLIVALVVALIALIIKKIIIRRKKNASDAKSHYKVTSRYNAKKDAKKEVKEEKKEEVIEEDTIETSTETQEETESEQTENEEKPEEQKLDDYVYGDVQNFGEELETNEEKPTDDVPSVEEVNEANDQAEEQKEPTEEKPE
ncbi:MAG: hypothetical protein KBS91_01050 [Firmicutes bacterium]|nr:hypothetical protein [Candidatus Caballimonas caccae]